MKLDLQVIFSVLAYSACSGSLVLVNKLILYHLPYPSLVITVQLFATLVFIYTAKYSKLLQVDELVWTHIVPYLYYIVAFSLGVYCNMKSLALSNVETVIVFRALSPVLVAFADALFLGRHYPNTRSWAALLAIVAGAYGYASFDEEFKTQGIEVYGWPTAYLFLISFEMAYAKKLLKSVDLKTLSGPVLYTNLLGLPPMLLFAALGKEYSHFYNDVIVKNQSGSDNGEDWDAPSTSAHIITAGVIFLILLGCVAGTAIGYSAWWCRDMVSATTFTLVGVLNKFLTIIVNFLIWDQHAPPAGILCLGVCLIGGTFYQQAPLRDGAPGDTKYAIVKANEDDNDIECATLAESNEAEQ